MAGMREVAKLAEVSLSTVSIILNGKDKYVSPEIRRRVENAILETGYTMPPKQENAPKAIAVVLPVITSVFFSNLLNGIEQIVTQNRHVLLFGNTCYRFEDEMQYLKMIKKQNLCGVIIDTVCPVGNEEEYYRFLDENFLRVNIPVVFLERRITNENFYSVYVDHYKNAYMATEHLIQQGHRKIAHIAGYPNHLFTNQRYDAYRKALSDNGLAFDEGLVVAGDYTPNSGYVAMKQLMSRRSDFTAIFSANDQMAIGAIKAARSMGKKIPDDIAVIGIDNLSISSIISPALTTVNVPTFEMGFQAAKIIIDILNGLKPEREMKLNCNIIVRKSTNPYTSSEWELFGW